MRRIQRVRDLNSQIQHALHRQRSSADQVLQRLPVQKLHGDERLPLVFANLVDRADVGMVERRGGLRLALEPFECLAIARHAVGKKFQGHRTTQARILSFVHNAHTATTQLRDDAVMRNYLAKCWFPFAHKRACYYLRVKLQSVVQNCPFVQVVFPNRSATVEAGAMAANTKIRRSWAAAGSGSPPSLRVL